MKRKRLFLSRVMLGFWGILFLSLATAHAQFLIEFTDGRRMKVPSYKEEGHKVKVYTPSGSFAFHKSDIKRVVTLGVPATQAPAPPKKPKKQAQQVAAVEPPEVVPVVAAPVVEKKLVEPQEERDLTPADQLWDSLRQVPMWDFMGFLTDWLYQVRYLIGLLAFGKVLKLFLVGSVR